MAGSNCPLISSRRLHRGAPESRRKAGTLTFLYRMLPVLILASSSRSVNGMFDRMNTGIRGNPGGKFCFKG